MAIMGRKGDEKMTWDAKNDIQVNRAREKFAEYKKKGYRIYVSKDIAGQRKGEEMLEFDPQAERIIVVPPMQGGAY